ncbi:MAG: hypothetical protein KUG81_09920 [Gammaproteobacteria bacterium]|nr:hypothetical protein [Gammaproteobacteria bacterium]
MTPKTNAENQKARDDRKRAMGWFQKKYWCTRPEHAHLDECLAKYRKKQERVAKKRKDLG